MQLRVTLALWLVDVSRRHRDDRPSGAWRSCRGRAACVYDVRWRTHQKQAATRATPRPQKITDSQICSVQNWVVLRSLGLSPVAAGAAPNHPLVRRPRLTSQISATIGSRSLRCVGRRHGGVSRPTSGARVSTVFPVSSAAQLARDCGYVALAPQAALAVDLRSQALTTLPSAERSANQSHRVADLGGAHLPLTRDANYALNRRSGLPAPPVRVGSAKCASSSSFVARLDVRGLVADPEERFTSTTGAVEGHCFVLTNERPQT